MLDNWLPFLIYGAFALLIPSSMVLMSFAFATRPSRRNRARMLPFESGVSTGPLAQRRFTVSFYLTAMLFIVFDIEIVFLYPLAVAFDAMGTFALVEMVLFIVPVFVAYWYVWRRGGLDWD
jgi:NADH-quinone oxidoreductase subunit A